MPTAPLARRASLVAVVTLLLASASCGADEVTAPPALDGDRLVFDRFVDGTDHIFTMRSDGSDAQILVPGPSYGPRLAPDRRRLLYHTFDSVGGRVVLINVDGSGKVTLPHGMWMPEWSPDGERILVSRDGSVGIARPDGAGWSPLAPLEDGLVIGWSPDGVHVAWIDYRGVQRPMELRIANVVTGAVRSLNGSGWEVYRAGEWSPDGRRLALACRLPRVGTFHGIEDVCLASAEGSALIPLTAVGDRSAFTSVGQPSWSPDGSRLAVSGQLQSDPSTSSVVVLPGGSGTPTALFEVPDGSVDARLVWSPDGGQLAIAVGLSQRSQFYVAPVQPDAEPRQITTGSGYYDLFDWVP